MRILRKIKFGWSFFNDSRSVASRIFKTYLFATNRPVYISPRHFGFHKHRWKDSGRNVFGEVIEQSCRCWQYRHRLACDLDGLEVGSEPGWRNGGADYYTDNRRERKMDTAPFTRQIVPD